MSQHFMKYTCTVQINDELFFKILNCNLFLCHALQISSFTITETLHDQYFKAYLQWFRTTTTYVNKNTTS